jgi:Methyltransferase domain
MRRAIEIIAKLPGELIGAEIGVYTGNHSLMMFQHIKIKHLYLVDPYKMYPEWTSYDLPVPPDKAKIEAAAKMSTFPVTWLYEKFEDCTEKIPDLDFIYIDALHTTEAVLGDIARARCLVRKGGIISGHDYNLPPVRKALDLSEMIISSGKNDGGEFGEDWWFVKE